MNKLEEWELVESPAAHKRRGGSGSAYEMVMDWRADHNAQAKKMEELVAHNDTLEKTINAQGERIRKLEADLKNTIITAHTLLSYEGKG